MKIVDNIINGETRFIIIDENTGEIIDDAQGYGFKSYEKANNFIKYKQKFPNGNIDYKDKIKSFYKTYPELKKISDEIESWLWYAMKDGDKINSIHLKNKIMKEIRTRIPELNEILLSDENLKYQFLKKF